MFYLWEKSSEMPLILVLLSTQPCFFPFASLRAAPPPWMFFSYPKALFRAVGNMSILFALSFGLWGCSFSVPKKLIL